MERGIRVNVGRLGRKRWNKQTEEAQSECGGAKWCRKSSLQSKGSREEPGNATKLVMSCGTAPVEGASRKISRELGKKAGRRGDLDE